MHRILPAALLGAALLSLPALSASAAGADIAGVWRTPKGWQVKIHPCGGAFCGTVVGGTSERDVHNPNPKLRSRKMVGVRLLWGLKKSGNEWRGKLYNPHDGKVYTGKISGGAATLKLSGCVLGGLICRGQTWHRMR